MKFFTLKAIGGVTYNQVADGSLRIYVGDANALRVALIALAEEIATWQVNRVEEEKQREQQRMIVPPSRMQLLERELEELRLAAAATSALAAAPPVQGIVPIISAVPFDEEAAKRNTIVSGGISGD